MSKFDVTTIIPMYGQPNFLAITLQGLVKHSILKHRILVVYSRPEVQGFAGAHDYIMRQETLKGYHKYKNVQDYHEKHIEWCYQNNIEFVDVTEQCLEFEKKYKAGEVYPGGIWAGGQDTAFKDNIGLRMADTEFVVNNWDGDFYPGPGWDAPLAEVLRKYANRRVVGIPVHVQPYARGRSLELPDEQKNIFEDTRHLACNRPILILPYERDNNQVYEQEWINFVDKWQSQDMVHEQCGIRNYCHWVPEMMRTSDAQNIIGEWGYKGSGYDLEFDDTQGRLGFVKIQPRTSFILHKGFIVDEMDA